MKKSVLSILCGVTLLTTTLTGCTMLPMPPSQPENPDVSTTLPDHQDPIEGDTIDENRLEFLVNNTLDNLQPYFHQKSLTADLDYSYNNFTAGYSSKYRRYFDYNGNEKNTVDIEAEKPNDIQEQYSCNFNGTVDNLFYFSLIKNRQESRRDTSRYYLTENRCYTRLDKEYDRSSVETTTHENGQTIFFDGSNEREENNSDFNKRFGEIYYNIYQLTSSHFDFKISYVNTVLTILNLITYRFEQEAYIADIVTKTLNFLLKDMTCESYLNYLYTYVLNEDISLLDEESKQILLSALASIQSIDISKIFVKNETADMYKISFNYDGLLTIVNNIKDILKQVIDLMAEYQDMQEYKDMIVQVENILRQVPDKCILEAMLTISNNNITNIDAKLNISGIKNDERHYLADSHYDGENNYEDYYNYHITEAGGEFKLSLNSVK